MKKILNQAGSSNRIFVGFDIGKFKHSFAIINEFGQVLRQSEISNKKEEFLNLFHELKLKYTNILMACEATSYYHHVLGKTSLEENLELKVINPVLTTTKAMRTNIRSLKTDASDALGIAKKFQEKNGSIGYTFTWDEDKERLQVIVRAITKLQNIKTRIKAMERSINERGFVNPVDVDNQVLDDQIDQLKAELVTEAKRIFPQEMELLNGTKGIGDETLAVILAEAKGITRFTKSKSFVAFAGLDPSIKQSGISIHGKSHMTKSGSSILRKRLTWSAKLLVQWNPIFKQRFDYDIKRGKPIGVAYGIIAKKISTIIHQCLATNSPFDPSKVGVGKDQIFTPNKYNLCFKQTNIIKSKKNVKI